MIYKCFNVSGNGMKGRNCGITRVTFPKSACRSSSGFT